MSKNKHSDHQHPSLSRHFLESWAKQLRRNLRIPHFLALEIIANHSGYSKWQYFLENGCMPKRFHPYFACDILSELSTEVVEWTKNNLHKSKLVNTPSLSYKTSRPLCLLFSNEVERLSPDEIVFISHIIRDGEPYIANEELSSRSVDSKLTRIDSSLLTNICFMQTYQENFTNSHIYDFRTSVLMYCRIEYCNDAFQISIPELDILMARHKAQLLSQKWFPDFVASFIKYTNDSLVASKIHGEISYSKMLNEPIASNHTVSKNIARNLMTIGGRYEFCRYGSMRSAEMTFDF